MHSRAWNLYRSRGQCNRILKESTEKFSCVLPGSDYHSVVARKTETIPFGAEIPPELAKAFSELMDGEGWVKKRALAAAVRSFLAMKEEARREAYKEAYKPPDRMDREDRRGAYRNASESPPRDDR